MIVAQACTQTCKCGFNRHEHKIAVPVDVFKTYMGHASMEHESCAGTQSEFQVTGTSDILFHQVLRL